MDSSEKDRILEMHKKKGYRSINEEPTSPKPFVNPFNQQQNVTPNSNTITPNQNNALNAGYGVISKEDAEKLAITTKNFTIKPAGQQPQPSSQSSQQKPVGQQPQTQAQVQQKKPGTNKPYPWKVSPSAADVQSGNSTIVKGMSGNSVTEIQNLLNAGGSKLNPDGKFGTNTYNALIAFQKKSGATNQKGIVDADTYNKLKGGGQESIEIDNSSIDMGSSVGGDKGYDVADNTAGPSSNVLDMS